MQLAEGNVIRIYVADDDVEVRYALRLLLKQQPACQIVGEAAHSHGLVALVESAQADTLLLDWELPGGVDAWLLADLHGIARRPCIVVLGRSPDQHAEASRAGADAFADKSSPPQQLLSAIVARASDACGGL
jgi:DNA-binding NarL/FixJ family response regulator